MLCAVSVQCVHQQPYKDRVDTRDTGVDTTTANTQVSKHPLTKATLSLTQINHRHHHVLGEEQGSELLSLWRGVSVHPDRE